MCGQLQELSDYHAELFRGGVGNITSESGGAPYGCTIGLREDVEGESFGNAGAITSLVFHLYPFPVFSDKQPF